MNGTASAVSSVGVSSTLSVVTGATGLSTADSALQPIRSDQRPMSERPLGRSMLALAMERSDAPAK